MNYARSEFSVFAPNDIDVWSYIEGIDPLQLQETRDEAVMRRVLYLFENARFGATDRIPQHMLVRLIKLAQISLHFLGESSEILIRKLTRKTEKLTRKLEKQKYKTDSARATIKSLKAQLAHSVEAHSVEKTQKNESIKDQYSELIDEIAELRHRVKTMKPKEIIVERDPPPKSTATVGTQTSKSLQTALAYAKSFTASLDIDKALEHIDEEVKTRLLR